MPTRAPCRRLVRGLACLLLAAGAPVNARADVGTPFYGVRSMGMGGAHRGLATGNDALFVNPAGMAIDRRYSAEVQYATGSDHVSRAMLSTVDSKTAPVAAGLAYARSWGNPSGEHPALNQFNMALGWAPLPVLAFGLGAVNVHGAYNEAGRRLHVTHYNAALSAMLSLGQLLGVGVSWENFIPVGKAQKLTPHGLGVGVGVRASIFSVGADMRFDLGKRPRLPRTIDVGGEALFFRFVAVRGGWRLVPDKNDVNARKDNVVTAGAALNLGGGGLEFGMEKALGSRDWRLSAGLQFSM